MHLGYRTSECVGVSQQKLSVSRMDFAARRKNWLAYIVDLLGNEKISVTILQFLPLLQERDKR